MNPHTPNISVKLCTFAWDINFISKWFCRW